MRINGDTNRLGNWNKGSGPLFMEKGKERVWLTGEKIKPWEKHIRFSQLDFPDSNFRLVYKYSLNNSIKDQIIWEREPSRYLIIVDPNEYQGFGEDARICKNSDRAFIVNGRV